MADIGGPLTGTESDDFLIGDARDLGDRGCDNYGNSGLFALKGFGGNDIIVGDIYLEIGSDAEGDEIYGGDGNDIIYGDTAPDLTALGVSTPYDGNPDWAVIGSSDKIYGDAGDDTVYGGGGFDEIYGGSGVDTLYGQAGTDYIYGDQGADQIWGGGGGDQVYGGAGGDSIEGGEGADSLYGEAFSSSTGDGGDTINGGSGNDDIRGGAGADTLSGGADDDRISGGGLSSDASNDKGDTCSGGAGDDVIDGNFGNDKINGGTGLDTLTGGDGNDQFIFLSVSDSRGANIDIITDFNPNAADRIDLSAIDAVPGGSDNEFTFRGSSGFNGVGQVRVVQDKANGYTFIKISTDADTGAEMTIRLNGVHTLDQGNFIL